MELENRVESPERIAGALSSTPVRKPIIADHMSYLVIDRVGICWERDIADMDRKSTVKDIADGQFGFVNQVIEFNPVEGICRDVSEDIARDVMTLWASGDPLLDWQYDFVALHVSLQAADSFRRVA